MATQLDENDIGLQIEDPGEGEDTPDLDLDGDDEPGDDAPDDEDSGDDASDGTSDQGDAEEDVITFGGTAVASTGDEPEGVRSLRQRLREREREIADLRGTKAAAALGEKPNIDDYWDRTDEYDTELLAWNERKRKADDAADEAEKLNQSVVEEVQAGHRAYQEQRTGLKLPGYDAADDKVTEALPDLFVNALNLAAGGKAAALRYYLGTHPDELDKIKKLDPRKITDVIRCAALAGSMAKEINVTRKPTTQPEQRRSGGTGGAARIDGRLARLEAQAEKSGDYSALVAYQSKVEKR